VRRVNARQASPGGEDRNLNLSKIRPRWVKVASRGPSLAILSALLFISLFVPWYQQLPNLSGVCAHGLLCYSPPAQVDGWNGIGIVAGVLPGLLVLWEGLLLTEFWRVLCRASAASSARPYLWGC
jgi:hypothetical protein